MAKRDDPRKARVGQTWYVVDFRGVHAVHLMTPFDLECFYIFYVGWPNAMFGSHDFCTRSKRKARREFNRMERHSRIVDVLFEVSSRKASVEGWLK